MRGAVYLPPASERFTGGSRGSSRHHLRKGRAPQLG
jgi:hypothetical protein